MQPSIPNSHKTKSNSLPTQTKLMPEGYKTGFFSKLILTLKMIKIQHTVFALPFALASVFIATNGNPSILSLFMIVLAMITARNVAMTFNRIIDRNFDKKNPRTAKREIPSGKLSIRFATIFCTVNSILFMFISLYFNWLTFILSPIALIIITGYSLTKRFTNGTQFFLGLALGISPIAAWIAMTGKISLFSLLLGLAVFCWVAGFDIIYSTMDYDYDKKQGLKNMVVKLGVKQSLLLSQILHLLSVIFLVLGGYIIGLSVCYFTGIFIIAGLLIYEHSLIKHNDLSKVNMSFFTMNGYISIIFLIAVICDLYTLRV